MPQPNPFLERVLRHLPCETQRRYRFVSWNVADTVTPEAVGLLQVEPVDPQRLLDRVLDLDHYAGHIAHVVECRSVADERFLPPTRLRCYQRIQIPLLGQVHHELVMSRLGSIEGFEVAHFALLVPETEALDPCRAIRSQSVEGAWLVAPDRVCYALSSTPRRTDTGWIKWMLLTRGAGVAASSVIRETIEAMTRWSRG